MFHCVAVPSMLISQQPTVMWFPRFILLSLLSGAQKAAKIALEGVIVLKVNVKAGNAPALQLDVNVTQMFAGIVGLGIEFSYLFVASTGSHELLPLLFLL